MNNENKNYFSEFCQNEKQRLLSYEEDWDENDGMTTTEENIDIAFNFLKNHCASNKYLEINLCPDGTIDLEWNRIFELGSRVVLLINCKKETVSYYGESTLYKIKGTFSINEISEEIKNFIILYFK